MDNKIIDECAPYTMTSVHRLSALYSAMDTVRANNIEGSIVECGVWKGGSMMLCAYYMSMHEMNRPMYLFDTYKGMTEPNKDEKDINGTSGFNMWKGRQKSDHNVWAYSPVTEVRNNMLKTGYNGEINYIKGDVLETLDTVSPGKIAILRLDTDFYESTKKELEVLYPLLSEGGLLIIDDYGWWSGSRKATNEYFGKEFDSFTKIDGSAIMRSK